MTTPSTLSSRETLSKEAIGRLLDLNGRGLAVVAAHLREVITLAGAVDGVHKAMLSSIAEEIEDASLGVAEIAVGL